MADEQGNASLVLDIQFEDGSVQKGFVRLAGLGRETAKKVEGEFSGIRLLDFSGMAAQGAQAMNGISAGMAQLGLVVAGVAGTIATLKTALNFGLEGERIKAVGAQFNMLAEQAGLVGDELKASLERSADGLIDVDQLLSTANSQMINLGTNATRLPEILELARRVTNTLGGDLQARFEGISSAIEGGNAKALKAQGIYIDSDKALRNMAQALGLNTGELNLAQRQQAVLNATLDQMNTKWKNTSENVQPATDNVKRFTTTVGELVDKMKVGFSNSSIFSNFTDLLGVWAGKGGADAKNGIATQVAGMIAQRMMLENKIAQLIKNPTLNKVADEYNIKGMRNEIAYINQEIAKSGAKVVSNTKTVIDAYSAQEAASRKKAATVVGNTKAELDATQRAAIAMRALAVKEATSQGGLSQNAIAAQRINLMTDEYTKREALVRNFSERIKLVEADEALKRRQIQLQFTAGTIGTATERNAKLIQLANETKSTIAQIEIQQSSLIDSFGASLGQNTNFENISSSFGLMWEGMKESARNANVDIGKSLKNLGAQFKGTFQTQVSGAIFALAQGTKNGSEALQDLFTGLLNSMGEMLITQGLGFMLQGAAFTWAGVPNGPALVSAGAAMAAFGATMAAVSAANGGAMGASSPSGSGGGVASDPMSGGNAAVITKPEDLERKKPDTYVNLTVQGDVFDSSETGFRIADLLNRAFDKNGIVLNGAV